MRQIGDLGPGVGFCTAQAELTDETVYVKQATGTGKWIDWSKAWISACLPDAVGARCAVAVATGNAQTTATVASSIGSLSLI